MGRLTHQFAVKTSSPKTDFVVHFFVGVCLSLECKLPVIIGDGVFVVIVPDTLDSDLSKSLDSIIPPFETNFGSEINVTTLATLTTTSTPKSGNTSLLCARIGEECAGINELLVFGVVGEDVWFDICNDADTFVVVICDKFGWVGESVLVPGEDVARLWFCLCDGVTRGELEGGAGDVVSVQRSAKSHSNIRQKIGQLSTKR